MSRRFAVLSFALTALLVSACASRRGAEVLEEPADVPHQYLGTLLVRDSSGAFFHAGNAKERLEKVLSEKAKRKYGADAVVETEYRLPIDNAQASDADAYAEGKMIRYKPLAS